MEEFRGSYRGAYFVALLAINLLTLADRFTAVQTQFTLNYVVSLPFTGPNRIGKYIVAAAKIAEEDIRAQDLIPATFPLNMLVVNDRCSGMYTMRGALTIGERINQTETKPDFVALAVGGICSVSCRALANYYGTFNVPFISTGCFTEELTDRSNEGYPKSARVLNAWLRSVVPFFDLINDFSFKKIGLLALESNLDWLKFKQGLKIAADERQIPYTSGRMRPSPVVDVITEGLIGSAETALKGFENNTMVIALLMSDRQLLATLLAAKRLNMLKDYVYIGFGYSPDFSGEMFTDPEEAKNVQEGFISINSVRPNNMADWTKFESRVVAAVPTVQAAIGNSVESISAVAPVSKLSVYAGLLYDGIMMWARAVKSSNVLASVGANKTLSEDDKQKIINLTLKSKFTGITGPIAITKTGDNRCILSVDIIQKGAYVPLLQYDPNSKKYKTIDEALASIVWSGGRKTLPVGYPEPCGFDNVLCPPPITATLGFRIGVAFGAFFLVVILILLIWYSYYRKAKQLAELKAITAWIINCDEVLTNFDGKSIADSKRLSSAVRKVAFGTMDSKQQTYSSVGFYKDRVVCIKKVERGSVDERDPSLFSELKEMRSIKNENVNDFVGVCIVAPNVCYMTVYCKHGSLQDIVHDDQFELGNEFKISFAMDVAQGMEYLHESAVGSHGRLNSSNCVIDSKWTCKITDYGMGNFRRKIYPPEINEKYFANKLWTAPELLRLPDDELPVYGTQEGDVYSYGIVLQELAMRDAPFSKLVVSVTYQDMIEMLKTASTPPFRPVVSETACSAEWMRLMTSCWAEAPDERPTFREVMKTAKLLSEGQAINIVDNMMKKLEKHNEKLEELVAVRTEELNVEKKKVKLILYNILPTSVAESLMRQGRVAPEAFDLATIYFSDIVGFMKINQSSTAYQIVDLLNGIYSIFDNVTDIYDVFKCETIGDVYMVASGLPVRNGDRHASEIATMALHLLSSVASFKIPHMPDKFLQLRIGLHTGPVVAGVVGQKMPHYCLFGDTVNTASRMQSGGLALRIHSSSTCADLLMSSGQFQLEFRGEREVKGKGLMKTYWVLSKTGFDMPLPDLSIAATLEEHEFK